MDKKEMIKEFYEVIISGNRIEELDNYISEDCTVRIGDQNYFTGIQGMKEHLSGVKTTYPDLTIKILRQHTDGDFVISEIIMEGTHRGEWLGIKPSGKKLSITGVNIDCVPDGKIIEHGGAANAFDTLWDKGIIKAAEPVQK